MYVVYNSKQALDRFLKIQNDRIMDPNRGRKIEEAKAKQTAAMDCVKTLEDNADVSTAIVNCTLYFDRGTATDTLA